jgi:polyisoprenoid-binding protein YceI
MKPLFTRAGPWATLVGAALLAHPALSERQMTVASSDSRNQVHFTARTTLFDVQGRFEGARVQGQIRGGDLSTLSVSAQVPTATVDTGIKARDKHLRGRDFFWADRFPLAQFESTRVERRGQTWWMQGLLNLRDKTQPIGFPLEMSGSLDEGTLIVTAHFSVSRSALGIDYQGGVLMPRIEDQVEVRIIVRPLVQRDQTPDQMASGVSPSAMAQFSGVPTAWQLP